jgi:hypothetical protein
MAGSGDGEELIGNCAGVATTGDVSLNRPARMAVLSAAAFEMDATQRHKLVECCCA